MTDLQHAAGFINKELNMLPQGRSDHFIEFLLSWR